MAKREDFQDVLMELKRKNIVAFLEKYMKHKVTLNQK